MDENTVALQEHEDWMDKELLNYEFMIDTMKDSDKEEYESIMNKFGYGDVNLEDVLGDAYDNGR